MKECLLRACYSQRKNLLSGCLELVHLVVTDITTIDVELLKKVIFSFPKLKILSHGLMVNASAELTTEEITKDTATCIHSLYAGEIHGDFMNNFPIIFYDILGQSPIFTKLRNSITTVPLKDSYGI